MVISEIKKSMILKILNLILCVNVNNVLEVNFDLGEFTFVQFSEGECHPCRTSRTHSFLSSLFIPICHLKLNFKIYQLINPGLLDYALLSAYLELDLLNFLQVVTRIVSLSK